MRPDTLKSLLAAREAKVAVALVSALDDGAQAIVHPDRVEGALALDDETVAAARAALRSDKGTRVEAGGRTLFIQVFTPPKRLIIVGARSEEHTSELQSLMRISYAVFCWKQK